MMFLNFVVNFSQGVYLGYSVIGFCVKGNNTKSSLISTCR